MEQKKFMDIERLVEKDGEVVPGVFKKANCGNFAVGDRIQISEKIDGANASICYDEKTGKLAVFSRQHQLGPGGLRGFYDYIATRLKPEDYADCKDYVIFGEWLVSHNCKYDTENYNKWYCYDIWDKSVEQYLDQDKVKNFCDSHGLIYVHVLYDGPFVSWDHCRSFCRKNTYGSQQEGIVVKNQTRLNSKTMLREPVVLKIVNDEFIETKHTPKAQRPETLIQRRLEEEAMKKMEVVLTENRVRKIMLKCIDEGLIPDELKPTNMPVLVKTLPRLVYEDLLKEEPEVMKDAAERAGRLCSSLTIKHIKKLVLN